MNGILNLVMKHWKVIGIVLIALSLSNTFKGIFNPSDKGKVEDKLKENTKEQTLSAVQVRTVAEQIYSATVTEGLSDTYAMLIRAFDLIKNQADFNAIYNYFGVRQYSKYWGNQGDPIFSGKHDMLEIIVNELSDSQLKSLRMKYTHLSF